MNCKHTCTCINLSRQFHCTLQVMWCMQAQVTTGL